MSGGTRPASPGAGSPAPTMPQASGSAPTEAPVQQQAPPQITGETRGVVGIAHLNLSAATDPTRGSLLTSDKNNVKLDNGTLMLLRVDR
jgi:hypothetical protein